MTTAPRESRPAPARRPQPGDTQTGSTTRARPGAEARFAEYRASGRDRTIRDALFDDHLPLARSLAQRYIRGRQDADDVLQVAYLGLVKAIERFDPSRGVAFTSFAVPTITGEIKRYFRDTSWTVHVPRRLRDLDASVSRAGGELAQLLGRQPQLDEIAAALDVEVDEVVLVMAARTSRRSASLERLAWDPTAAVDEALARFEMLDELARAIDGLDERARLMLTLRYRDELSQRAIGERLGISQVHVSRLLTRHLRTLREHLDAQACTP